MMSLSCSNNGSFKSADSYKVLIIITFFASLMLVLIFSKSMAHSLFFRGINFILDSFIIFPSFLSNVMALFIELACVAYSYNITVFS